MSSWKECKLGEVAEIIMGQSPTGDTCNTNGKGTPLLNGPTEFGIQFPKAVQFTISPKKISEINDILFCVRGSTTGRMNWANEHYALGRGLASIRHRQGHDYRYFIKALLDFNLPVILASATGSTFPNVSREQLENLDISLPPLEEQKAIAEILSSLDDKIDLLHRQNQTLESLAQTLFRQWFEDKEFDGIIGDIIKLQSGYAFKSKDFQYFGIHGVLKIKNISNSIIDIFNTDFIDLTVANKTDEKFKILSGDILFGMTGAEIGKMGIVPKTDKNLWLNQRVGVLREKYLGAKYLAYLQLTSEFGFDYITSTATGSAQPNISAREIEQCPFVKLEVDEIENYSNEISPLFEKIIFNLGQIQTLENLRDTLLPKLLSGEIKIKD
ncbi:restriction endonuclease subunit S [Aliarcobacter butzleri]|uniref:restriction endonuclease subunit S n=1 Tax=Aliarcobacter butzleri TaxID=28197 RepID=UPI002B24E0F2|nr:restriction endonuclease subunit S [Aliarcobacter butzleri]